MDLRKIKTLVDLVSESNIAELEITESEGTVRIVKGGVTAIAPPALAVVAPSAPPPVAAVPAASAAAAAATAEPAAAQAGDAAGGHRLKAPMVGTFYNAPSPDAKPFVAVGDTVKKGQIVCIIEAMKIMNEIEADASGTIARVAIENGQGVEYGQVLFELA